MDRASENDLREILEQLASGYAVLFLGSGSTYNCRRPDGRRGLTGEGLASEILEEINNGANPGFKADLMHASEFFTSVKAATRRGLDEFIQNRLTDLQPTIGHYIAASLPWRAVVTTNYNRVAEDAWHEAHANGFAANEIVTIRTDEDITQHAGNTQSTRLYKPHGCISIHKQQSNRMVLTSLDYFESERVRSEIYRAIRSIAKDCTTVFVGYSTADFTFRNIFFRLYSDHGHWAPRSFSVSPFGNQLESRWMSESMRENEVTSIGV